MYLIKEFFEAASNIHEFLFYFFSVKTLVRTLFHPWKNIITNKQIVGFTFEDWFSRFSFNAVSVIMGGLMRISLLIFYFLMEILFVISIPFIFAIFLLFIPILLFTNDTQKESDEKIRIMKSNFVNRHLLEPKNLATVEGWFEEYYASKIVRDRFYSKTSLFSIPPLARDWSTGYTPQLDRYSQDLTDHAYQLRIPQVIDREHEINLIERTLIKNGEANVLIVGEEGVGKHTIVDSLTHKMYLGKTNEYLMYKRVLKLNMEQILSSSTDPQQKLALLEDLFEEAVQAKNIIIFIDDFEKYLEFMTPIEKYGQSSLVHFIGITTPFSFQQHIFTNQKITRLFTKIDVYEMTKNEALSLLMANAFSFENRYHLNIPYETLLTLVDKSDYYVTTIPFPEKAVDLLDQVCVYASQKGIMTVTIDLLDLVLTEKTHIPTTLTDDMKTKLLNLKVGLLKSIIGQDEAINQIAFTLDRSFILMGKRKNPLARLLLLGPTGVGKTETAKTIARLLFDDTSHLIRFDMSAYQLKEDIHELLEHLTSAVRQHPYGVLLLDEIEKANLDLRNIFLTMLDEGYLVDGLGKRVDCRNLVIIATSNAGFENTGNLVEFLIDNYIFLPEFLNRFDNVIEYKKLDTVAILQIANKLVKDISKEILSVYHVNISVSEQFIQEVAHDLYNPKFGARDMERHLRQTIEQKVAEQVLTNKIDEKQTIII